MAACGPVLTAWYSRSIPPVSNWRRQHSIQPVTPRVLISVTNAKRQAAILHLITQLPAPADRLFHVTTADQAVNYLLRVLRS